jgi:hypothetical protein
MEINVKFTREEIEDLLNTLWDCGCVSITDKGYVIVEQLQDALEKIHHNPQVIGYKQNMDWKHDLKEFVIDMFCLVTMPLWYSYFKIRLYLFGLGIGRLKKINRKFKYGKDEK